MQPRLVLAGGQQHGPDTQKDGVGPFETQHLEPPEVDRRSPKSRCPSVEHVLAENCVSVAVGRLVLDVLFGATPDQRLHAIHDLQELGQSLAGDPQAVADLSERVRGSYQALRAAGRTVGRAAGRVAHPAGSTSWARCSGL